MKYLLHGESSERLMFTMINMAHFDQWLPFHKDPLTSIHWKQETVDPESDCRQWYSRQFARHAGNLGGMNALIEKDSGKLIGHAGLLVQTVDNIPELEVAYSLLPLYWNQGFATEAARKIIDTAFERNYSQSLISIISVTNTPSANVARKNGLSIGKLTRHRDNDVHIFRIFNPAF